MRRYAIVIENAGANYSAYVPDLPGCVTTGATPAETTANMREAIGLHLSGLAEDQALIPEPSAQIAVVEVG
jgi:predicted RNase H-like HicB family nuclease